MPQHAVPAETDILCAHCGYALNGLPQTGLCPECGEPIADSTTASLTIVQSCTTPSIASQPQDQSVTAGSNALGDRAEAAFSKGDRTLKDDAAHQAALATLPDTAHFRLWIDSGRVLDVLLKNPLLKARLVEAGLSLDKITLAGPNRVVSALSVRSEVQTEVWTYRVDALNFQALAPLGAGAAVLAGGLSGLPGL